MKLLIARRFEGEKECYLNIPIDRMAIDDSLVYGYRNASPYGEQPVAVLSIGSFDAIYISEQKGTER